MTTPTPPGSGSAEVSTGGSAPASAPTTPGTPTATVPSSNASAGPVGQDAVDALQAAMAAEHAALWAYGLVAAYAPDAANTVSDMLTSHQNIRDVTANLLVQAGATPVGPAPAYTTPEPVTDPRSAMALALVIEGDCAAAWRSVIGHTDDSTLRGTALSALTDSAMRMVTWRKLAKDKVVTAPFPGAPDRD
ncbi:MAG TPA: ferritin-like domain-containing protein [Nakamurella sp.]|nr:ferritin-like domain-containing protein [Nakamurella sp.]